MTAFEFVKAGKLSGTFHTFAFDSPSLCFSLSKSFDNFFPIGLYRIVLYRLYATESRMCENRLLSSGYSRSASVLY